MSWPMVALGELMLERNSSTNPAKYPDELFTLYSIPAFDAGQPDKLHGHQIGSAKKNVEPGDVLLSRIVPHIRRSWVVQQHASTRILASSEWIVFRSKIADVGYLRHFLVSDPFHAQFMQTVAGVGGSLLRANPKQVADINIPLPPLPEQRRIAAILDKADALRRKRRQALDLLDSLTQSIFLEMFGARRNSDWPTCTIGEVASDIRTGPFGSQLLHSEFVDEGISVLGIDNAVANEFRWVERRFITSEKYRSLARYTVKPGDVLITIMGTCGRCAVVPDDITTSINTKHLCCITLDRQKCLPEFLHATLLQDPAVLRQLGVQSKGAVMPGLNMGIIKALRISLPPIDRQQAFANLVRNLEMQKQSRLQAASSYDVLFAALQSRAFSGEI